MAPRTPCLAQAQRPQRSSEAPPLPRGRGGRRLPQESACGWSWLEEGGRLTEASTRSLSQRLDRVAGSRALQGAWRSEGPGSVLGPVEGKLLEAGREGDTEGTEVSPVLREGRDAPLLGSVPAGTAHPGRPQ